MAALTRKELDETVASHRAWVDRHAPVDAPAASSVNEHDQKLIGGIMVGIAPFIHELEQKIEALQARVAELERNQKTYLGVWREAREYSPNSEVTHDGARWFCQKRTNDKPGSSCDWVMMEKSFPTANPRTETATACARQNGHHANPRPRSSP